MFKTTLNKLFAATSSKRPSKKTLIAALEDVHARMQMLEVENAELTALLLDERAKRALDELDFHLELEVLKMEPQRTALTRQDKGVVELNKDIGRRREEATTPVRRGLTRQQKGVADLKNLRTAQIVAPEQKKGKLTRQSRGVVELRCPRVTTGPVMPRQKSRGLSRQKGTARLPKSTTRCRITCGICEEQYGQLPGQVPRSLECGHTICETCCHRIEADGHLKCPFDRHVTPVTPQRGLPKNYTVLQLIQQK